MDSNNESSKRSPGNTQADDYYNGSGEAGRGGLIDRSSPLSQMGHVTLQFHFLATQAGTLQRLIDRLGHECF